MIELPEEKDPKIKEETWEEIQKLKKDYPGTARGIYMLALMGIW